MENGGLIAVILAIVAATGTGGAAVLRAVTIDRRVAHRDDLVDLRNDARELREELNKMHDLLMAAEDREAAVRRQLAREQFIREGLERQLTLYRPAPPAEGDKS